MKSQIPNTFAQDQFDAKLAIEAKKEGFASTQEVVEFIETLNMDTFVSRKTKKTA